jgi:hypothetical protein
MGIDRMALGRRAFLASLAATGLARAGWAAAGSPSFLSAAKLPAGDYAILGLTARGEEIFRVALPGRGHAGAAHPTRPLAVAFARRPGVFARVIDCVNGTVLAELAPPTGRQFNGHGAFSMDGNTLYTSEVVADGSQGRIGVWEVATWRRINEFASQGIGPHEVLRLPNSDTLVVANGGIQTDPLDRTPLNIDDMHPNLTYLAPDGAVLDQLELPDLAQNSIRHLSVRADGLIAFSMQWEGDPYEAVPLLGLHRIGGTVQLCDPALGEEYAMKGYAGSVAFSASGERVAISSPKGGRVQIHDAQTGSPTQSVAIADVCGLGSAAGGGFIGTDGFGGVSLISENGVEKGEAMPVSYDNHLISL